jgi:hypothetical protein
MKRTIQKWLGAAALLMASIGALAIASPASAAPLQKVTISGVSCGQYNSGYGTFPTTYWDCITPDTNTSQTFKLSDSAHSLPANIVSVLTAQNSQLFLFANSTDYAAFASATASTGTMGGIPPIPASVAAITGNGRMAAIFATVTIGGTPTSMNSYYAGNIRQQLGRIYGMYAPSNAKGDSLIATNAFFKAAINQDREYLSNTGTDLPSYPSSSTVWGATIAAAYPGKSPWEILQLRFGNTESYIYGFQVGREQATPTVTELNNVLQQYMTTTRNWVKQQVYLVNPQNYKFANLISPFDQNEAILCVEQNGYNNFPLKWWSCVRPYDPTVAAQSVNSQPHQLPAAWQTLLQNKGVEVLAMRSIDAWKYYTGAAPASLAGVYGISSHNGTLRSAAFQDLWTNSGGTAWTDNSSFYSGTIMHELGHQFDNVIWNGTAPFKTLSKANSAAVPGSIRFQNAVTADITAFNTGTCAAKVDADRLSNGKPAVCGLYSGTNWQILVQAESAYGDNEELWARAFARRAGGGVPNYYVAVQNRLTNLQAYMNDLWTTGAPHN